MNRELIEQPFPAELVRSPTWVGNRPRPGDGLPIGEQDRLGEIEDQILVVGLVG